MISKFGKFATNIPLLAIGKRHYWKREYHDGSSLKYNNDTAILFQSRLSEELHTDIFKEVMADTSMIITRPSSLLKVANAYKQIETS